MKYLRILIFYVILSATSFGTDFIEIHYKSQWDETFIQFNIDGRGWAQLPTLEEKEAIIETFKNNDEEKANKNISNYYFNNLGIEGNLMKESSYFEGYKYIKLPAKSLRFKFSNGGQNLDNNNNLSYYIPKPGRYIVKDNIITKLSNENVKIYYKSVNEDKDILYKYDSINWTEKGISMSPDRYYPEYNSIIIPMCEEVKVGNQRYTLGKSGVYKIESNQITYLSDSVGDKKDTVTIFYNTEKNSYIKFNLDNIGWSNKQKMNSLKEGENFVLIPYAKQLTFFIEDEVGEKTREYKVTSGVYSIDQNQNLKKILVKDYLSIGMENRKLKVFSQEREHTRFIETKEESEDLYSLEVKNNNYFYTIKYHNLSVNKVELLKEGLSLKKIDLVKNHKDSVMEVSNTSLPLGNLSLRFYKEENNKNLNKNNKIPLTNREYTGTDVTLISYGGWKELVGVTNLYTKEDKNYREYRYNMWLDFAVPNEYMGHKLKIVFLKGAGPVTKEFYPYKNGKIEGYLKYSFDILNVINSKGYETTNFPEVYFRIYVGNEVLGTYKYDLANIVENNTVVLPKEFIPYEIEYLGENRLDNKYIFDYKNKIFSVESINKVFYDGYYNKDNKFTNELIKIDTNLSVDLSIDNQFDKEVTLKWFANLKDLEYELYRSQSLMGTYVKLYKGTNTNYIDTLPEYNKVYYYKVKVIRGKEIFSNLVFTEAIDTSTEKITLKKLNESYDSIELTWNMLDKIKDYSVYKSVNENKYVKVKTLKSYNNIFIDDDLNPKSHYSYFIVGVTKTNKEIKSNIIEKLPSELSKIYNFNLDYDISKGMIISWDKLPNIRGYLLEKSTDKGKEDIKIKDTVYYDLDITVGVIYTYKLFGIEY